MGRKTHPVPRDGDAARRGLRRSIRRDACEQGGDELRPRVRAADAPPAVPLRRLGAETALARLEVAVQVHRQQGRLELLVVHGRGRNSPGGQPVLGPLVRQWCRDHPAIVAAFREAPPAWGGEGALVVTLHPKR